jgi:hypothetical protein
MTGRLLRFPAADPLEAVLARLAELDRAQLEQVREHLSALLEALAPAEPPAPPARPTRERPDLPPGVPRGPLGGGYIEWKRIPHGTKMYGPYPYLRLRIGGRQRSIYLKGVAQAARAREAASATG